MSDPFANDEPFGTTCSLCGSISCIGCTPSRSRRIPQLPITLLAAVGGVALGLMIGFLAFGGGNGSRSATEQEPIIDMPTMTNQVTQSTTSSEPARFLPTSNDETLMLELVNQVRSENGANDLTWCPALQRSSLAHSKDMSLRNYFDHDSPEGGTVLDRTNKAGYNGGTVGENIAFGQRSVNEVMRGWIESPGHFRNLINTAYEHFAYATASGQYESSTGLFWTQNFGASGKCD